MQKIAGFNQPFCSRLHLPVTLFHPKYKAMIFTKPHRLAAELNASSMADIAFLLLVFFLVSTVIDTEKGITIKLPPLDYTTPPPPVNDRNVLSVKINFEGQLLVEGEETSVESLRQQAKNFIMNPARDPRLAIAPNQAVISLQNDRSTTYGVYLAVYNELKAAYNELWEEAAQQRFGKTFSSLSRSNQQNIRDEIPLVISESDLVDLAGREKSEKIFIKNQGSKN